MYLLDLAPAIVYATRDTLSLGTAKAAQPSITVHRLMADVTGRVHMPALVRVYVHATPDTRLIPITRDALL